MQSTIGFLFIAIAVCRCCAKVEITEGSDISIKFDEPLTITFTNDKTSDVEFRHQQSVVAYCFRNYGCIIEDERFNIKHFEYAKRNEYILTSKNINHTDLCGVYECNDLLYDEKDSAQVSIKGFDNETYNAEEEKDTIYLTTACTFHVSLSDMQIFWYTYDNTTFKLLDETRMGNSMTPFNSESVCSATCGTTSAHSFTFGLNITDQEQGYTDVFIETKIFHPDYKNKPLTWRSSETFRVKDSSPQTTTSGVLLPIVLTSVCVVVLIAGVILAVKIFQRKRSTTNTQKEENTALEMSIAHLLKARNGFYTGEVKARIVVENKIFKHLSSGKLRPSMIVGLADSTGALKAIIDDPSQFHRFHKGNCVILRNFSLRQDMTVEVTRNTTSFLSTYITVPQAIATEAELLVHPPPAPFVSIEEAHSAPVKKIVSVKGQIVQEEQCLLSSDYI